LWVVTSSLTLLDVDLSAKVLGTLMCGEVIMVVIWIAAVGVDGGPSGISVDFLKPSVFTSGSISFGLLFALLSSLGFEAVAVFREETRDPVKTVPRATYLSVILLTGFYAVGAWAYITAFGPSKSLTASAADPSGSFTASMGQYVGTAAVDIVSVLLVTSAFAALLATQNIAARYLYTLGSDAVLPRALGKVHPRFGSPYVAAVVVAALTLLGFGVPTILGADPLKLYAGLAGLGAVGIVFLMTATNIAIVLFFRDPAHNPGAFKGLIAPVLAFLGLGTILVMAIKNMGAVVGGTQTLGNICTAFLVIVLAAGIGLALYYRRSRPDVYARIGRQDL
jgi:amino acid transporter